MYNRGHSDPYNPYPSAPVYEEEHRRRNEEYPPQSPPKHESHHQTHSGPAPPNQEYYNAYDEPSRRTQEHNRAQYDSAPHGAAHAVDSHSGGDYSAPQHAPPYATSQYEGGRPAPRYETASYDAGRTQEARRSSDEYSAGPYSGGRPTTHHESGTHSSGLENSSGPYGTSAHQTSPYANAPSHRTGAGAVTHGTTIPGETVKIYCKANPNFLLGVRPREGVVMMPANPHDDYQLWIQDESMSTRIKDSTGAPSFALVNKATRQALCHPPEDSQQVLLADYTPRVLNESLLWTQSEDMGDGYHCIRMANKITSNLDALQGDKKSGGVKDGTPAILFKWKKQENQIWKIVPVL